MTKLPRLCAGPLAVLPVQKASVACGSHIAAETTLGVIQAMRPGQRPGMGAGTGRKRKVRVSPCSCPGQCWLRRPEGPSRGGCVPRTTRFTRDGPVCWQPAGSWAPRAVRPGQPCSLQLLCSLSWAVLSQGQCHTEPSGRVRISLFPYLLPGHTYCSHLTSWAFVKRGQSHHLAGYYQK